MSFEITHNLFFVRKMPCLDHDNWLNLSSASTGSTSLLRLDLHTILDTNYSKTKTGTREGVCCAKNSRVFGCGSCMGRDACGRLAFGVTIGDNLC